MVHVGAVLFGRAVRHLDTNFCFAAAGFFLPQNQHFFGPNHFLAVLALSVQGALMRAELRLFKEISCTKPS